MNRGMVGKANSGGGALSGVWIDDSAKETGRRDRGAAGAQSSVQSKNNFVNINRNSSDTQTGTQISASPVMQNSASPVMRNNAQPVMQNSVPPVMLNNAPPKTSNGGPVDDRLDSYTGSQTGFQTGAYIETERTGGQDDEKNDSYADFYPVFDVNAALKNLKNIKKLYIAMLVSLKSNPLFDEIRLALDKNDYSLIGSSAAAFKNVAEKICLPDMLTTLGEIDAMARHRLQRPELADLFAQSSKRIFDRLDALIETLNREANN